MLLLLFYYTRVAGLLSGGHKYKTRKKLSQGVDAQGGTAYVEGVPADRPPGRSRTAIMVIDSTFIGNWLVKVEPKAVSAYCNPGAAMSHVVIELPRLNAKAPLDAIDNRGVIPGTDVVVPEHVIAEAKAWAKTRGH